MKRILYFLFLLPALMFAACNDDDNSPAVVLSDTVKSFISTKYPGAVITDAERTPNGLIEVDVVHDSKKKDIYFTQNDEWVLTEWDVPVASLPQAAVDGINVQYPGYFIDDVDYVQAPAGDYYLVNVEKGIFEKDLKVSLDGTVIDEL